MLPAVKRLFLFRIAARIIELLSRLRNRLQKLRKNARLLFAVKRFRQENAAEIQRQPQLVDSLCALRCRFF